MSKIRNVVLSEEMIQQRTKQKLSEVKNLNMWGYDLTDVSIVKKMPNLEVISLSLNHISSLLFFKDCKHLRDLFLRHNLISNFSELQHLKKLPALRSLWLSENPITSNPNYRLRVIHELPNLIKLDESDVTEEEKKKAKSMTFDDSELGKIDNFLQDTELNHPQNNSTNNNSTTHPKRILKLPPSSLNMSNQKNDDKPLITAILALLPELSNDSLDIVIQKVQELKK
ncbi:DNA damage response, detection of DNA damage [Tritrichomonas musculus]|uniref:DNA damage response, detection of DNA damage n=1 Tax=Tritrichomonas musculus TaxID=1915356 RepID=A0ABR2KPL3_9EUKA